MISVRKDKGRVGKLITISAGDPIIREHSEAVLAICGKQIEDNYKELQRCRANASIRIIPHP